MTTSHQCLEPNTCNACPLDLHRALRDIKLQAELAQLALEDEHEGRLRAAVFELRQLSTSVHQLVTSW